MGSDGEASSPIENAAPNTDLVEELDFSRRIFHVQPSSETNLDDRGDQTVLNEANGLSHHLDTDNNQQAVDRESGRQEGSKDNVEAIKDGTKPQLAGSTSGEAESQSGRNKEIPTERSISQKSLQQPEERQPRVSHDSLSNRKEKSRNMSSDSRPSTMESTKAGSDYAGFGSIARLEKLSLEEESTRILRPTLSRGTRKSSDNDTNRAPRNTAALNELFTDIIASAAPSLRHLASQSTLGESVSSAKRRSRTYERPNRLSTPVEEQRHPGKPGLWSDQFMKNIDEMVDWETKEANAISLASTSNLDVFGARSKPEKNEVVIAPPEPQELDAEIEYPGTLALTILTIGLCLSVLLISLDRTIITTVRLSFPFPPLHALLTLFLGNSLYQWRISFIRRRWVVWKCIPTYGMRVPANVRKNLYYFQYKMVISRRKCAIRDRIIDLWCSSEFSHINYRASDRWSWECGYFDRVFCCGFS